MMSRANGRVILVNRLVFALFVTMCRGSPVPDSGPGIEIQPAEFAVDGKLDYLVVGEREGVGERVGDLENQQLEINQPGIATQQPQNPPPQVQQQPQYYQPQYPNPQQQQPQYQQPPQYASSSGPVAVPPGQYQPYPNRPSYSDPLGLTSLTGTGTLAQQIIRPAAQGAALLGSALLFG